jgi:hypothetical protein
MKVCVQKELAKSRTLDFVGFMRKFIKFIKKEPIPPDSVKKIKQSLKV